MKLREYIETQIGHVQAEHARYERAHEEKHLLEKAIRTGEVEAVRRALELSADAYEKQLTALRIEVDRLRLVEANVRGQVIAYSAVFSILVSVVFFVLNKLL